MHAGPVEPPPVFPWQPGQIPPLSSHEFSQRDRLNELSQQVSLLYKIAKYREATALAERQVDLAKNVFGENHSSYATAISWLALLYRLQSRYGESESLAKGALSIDEKTLGAEHPNVSTHLDNLAQLYQEQERYGEAEEFYKRALVIVEKALGPEHPRVGSALNNLAWLYQAQGRYSEAEPLAKRAIGVVETARGPEDIEVGRILDTLARLYEGQGQVKEAEPHYKRALAILEKSLGNRHPEVAIVRGNLGGLYKSQGQLGDAEPLLESALAINEKSLGSNHPSVARSLVQLADLYRLQGLCDKAEPLFLRARRIGTNAIKEVAVLFATDRKRDTDQLSVTFGGDRGGKLSLGLTIVTLPKEKATNPAALQRGVESQTTATQITETRRLAMHCIQVVNDEEIVAAGKGRLGESKTYPHQALVFVHGYNVSFESGLRRAAQIAYDIKFDGGTFLFSWPAHEGALAWLWDYMSARDTVDIASEHLRQFLEDIIRKVNPARIHFVAHSMGNMVLLHALEKIVSQGSPLAAAIGEVVSAAPDVDPDVFVQMVRKINTKGTNVTLYASSKDRPLQVSGLLRNRPRAGYINDTPLLVFDTLRKVQIADTIDITSAGRSGWYDLFALDHDVYASSPTIVSDIQAIIQLGKRPPHERTKQLELVSLPEGTYWKLLAPSTAHHR